MFSLNGSVSHIMQYAMSLQDIAYILGSVFPIINYFDFALAFFIQSFTMLLVMLSMQNSQILKDIFLF